MEPVAAAQAAAQAGGWYGARRLVSRLLVPLAAVVVAAIGLRAPGGWPAAGAAAFVLAIAWALVGLADPARPPAKLSPGLLAALGALIAAAALTAARPGRG